MTSRALHNPNPNCWKIGESKTRNGREYFINIQKGESKWGLIPGIDTDLPIGWELHNSMSNPGLTYYGHAGKKHSQWEKPTEKDPELPENWAIEKSTLCKQTYYYNSTTGISQWDFPNIKPTTQQVDDRKLLYDEVEKLRIENIRKEEERQTMLEEQRKTRLEEQRKRLEEEERQTMLEEQRKTRLEEQRKRLEEEERRKPLVIEQQRKRLEELQKTHEEQKRLDEEEKQKSLAELKHVIQLRKDREDQQAKMQRELQIQLEKATRKVEETQKAAWAAITMPMPKKPTEVSLAKFNPDKVEIKWLSEGGSWALKEKNTAVEKTGYYAFNPDKLEITSTYDNKVTKERESKIATVMITKCKVDKFHANQFLAYVEQKEKEHQRPKGITIVKSNVQDVIQSSSHRHKMVVLPSQLNGAEYQSQYQVVDKLQEYIGDNTGGPRGQLAADPGVAQFIIDNASNQNMVNEDTGINNVRLMGLRNYRYRDDEQTLGSVYLKNGYLQVKEHVDLDEFIEKLPSMTIMGVRDIPVRGLNKQYQFIEDKGATVDLVYASAVPLRSDYGNGKTPNVITIANLTLFSQYIGAMRLAILRGNCDLYLTPLGGNAFKNNFNHIKAAIYKAYEHMEKKLKEKEVNVFIIVWEGVNGNGGEEEREAFGVK